MHAQATDGAEPFTLWTPGAVTAARKDVREKLKGEDDAGGQEFFEKLEREALGRPFLHREDKATYCLDELAVTRVSLCYSCRDIAIWKHDTILYPPHQYEIEPNPDMNEDIRADFDEARTLLDLSPRASAALLRLCVQKLCIQLGEKGENINADITALVKKGLDPLVAKALDVVRVVGNNAVHPGTLDMKDDRSTASKLFELVNFIATELITKPLTIKSLFDEKVPPGAKEQIARRDKPKE